MIFLKSIVVWLVFILSESLNGAIRIAWFVPSLGDVRAEQLSFVTGSMLLVTIASLFIRWLQASRISQLLRIGLLWTVLTLSFEITLGHWFLGYSWPQIAAKFNLMQGELMSLEIVLLMLTPFLATKIRDTVIPPRSISS